MRVFNELTKRFCNKSGMVRCVIDINDNYIEFGYYPLSHDQLMPIYFNYSGSIDYEVCDVVYILNKEENFKYLTFSNATGYYIITRQYSTERLNKHIYIKGQGNFPYSFKKYYEALESFVLFHNKQEIISKTNFNLSKYLKYTFGLEFETSCGYIPENICFRDGLIPLRDGSISGIEYSTVVLNGNDGLNLLKQQTDTLSKYTYFNKECALHIHLGGYPVNQKAIFTLYSLCILLERHLLSFIPRYSFQTSLYKKTQKDYCNTLPRVDNFNDLYEMIANQKYKGSLTDPHPYDVERNHKWECHSRYVWCNLLNMVCFDKCKTVEFRFLRPTFNFNKIYLWLAIFNAILMYAEMLFKKIEDKSDSEIINFLHKENINFETIINSVYPKRFADNVIQGINKLSIIIVNQDHNEDFCGRDTFFDDELFTSIF